MKLSSVLQSLHRHTEDAVLITKAKATAQGAFEIVFVNKSCEEQTGYPAEELLGHTPRILQGPETDQATLKEISEHLRRQEPVRRELLNYKKDGSKWWLELSIVPVNDAQGNCKFFVSIQRDITKRKETEQQLMRQKLQIEAQKEELRRINSELQFHKRHLIEAQRIAGMGSWYLDLKTKQVYWTEGIYSIFDLEPSSPPPKLPEHEKFFDPESWERLNQAFQHTIETGEAYDLTLQVVSSTGATRWMRTYGELKRAEVDGGHPIALQGAAQDVTAQKNAEAEIHELALSDSLTGIANRTAFDNHVERSINMHKRHGGQSTLLLLDLDDFKAVNDKYGHTAGDAVLKNVASILSNHSRKADVVARLGGDEFAVFFSNTADSFDQVEKVTQIINEIELPMEIDGQSIKADASAGIATYPLNAGNADDLLKRADVALYTAKKAKGSAYEIFVSGMTFPV